jgi:hypothetical protein
MMKTHILMPIMISMTRYYHNFKLNSILPVIIFRIHKIIFILSVITIAAIAGSCEEDPTTIGKGLFPGSDFVTVKSVDTLSVFGYTGYDSHVKSNKIYYSYLGELSDPYFGVTTSDIVTQLQLLDKWRGGGPLAVDSVRFFMTVTSFEGSVSSPQYISLSESTDDLSEDAIYYSDNNVHAGPAYGGLDFGTFPLPVENLKEDTASLLVCTLPNFVGEYLMRDTSKLFLSGWDILSNNDAVPDFKSFFKGLYIKLEDSPNPLFLTTVLSAESPGAGIYVYYHNIGNDTAKVFPFWINQNCVAFNRFTHSSGTGLPGKDIVNKPVKDTVSYLQNYEGVYTRIEIPGLKGLKSLIPIAVNKARIRIPVYFDADSLYKPSSLPTQIYARYKTAAGIKDTIPDYDLSVSYMGGRFDSDSSEYVFNIAVFTQLYLEGSIPDPVLELFLPEGTRNNVILKMNKNANPAKMEFTYTKF